MHNTTNELQEAWPTWRIWRADGGSWMATRRRLLTDVEVSEGLAHTLMEDTDHELAAELEQQRRIETALSAR